MSVPTAPILYIHEEMRERDERERKECKYAVQQPIKE